MIGDQIRQYVCMHKLARGLMIVGLPLYKAARAVAMFAEQVNGLDSCAPEPLPGTPGGFTASDRVLVKRHADVGPGFFDGVPVPVLRRVLPDGHGPGIAGLPRFWIVGESRRDSDGHRFVELWSGRPERDMNMPGSSMILVPEDLLQLFVAKAPAAPQPGEWLQLNQHLYVEPASDAAGEGDLYRPASPGDELTVVIRWGTLVQVLSSDSETVTVGGQEGRRVALPFSLAMTVLSPALLTTSEAV